MELGEPIDILWLQGDAIVKAGPQSRAAIMTVLRKR